ncbi:proline iminopeptidase [Fodinibius roseus]|uniref:Proline iminopeptidase n=1 Tax=Fodinibius roseus TaxID=1194090 RepID=A0A1M5HL87_9BACT|nr:alpha/beta hydrolase [Fodinibius roseus]SHG16658.1 proline iminopeptidase [Fodinibius roseus]
MIRLQNKTVEIAGIPLRCVSEGKGRPILVIGSSVYYPKTFSQDLRNSFRITYTDLPHFVQFSSGFQKEKISFEFYAECIETVRLAEGLDDFVIFGHSHHGNIALEYARKYPRHISHVVIVGSPPFDIETTVKESKSYWANFATDYRKQILQRRRKSLKKRQLTSLSPKEAFVAEYVTDAPMYWYDPTYDASWLWQDMNFEMRAVNAFRDLFRNYKMDGKLLKLPILVTMGRYDFVVPHTLWEPMLPNFQNVTFKLFEESGHTPQLEEAVKFNKTLTNWLQKNS